MKREPEERVSPRPTLRKSPDSQGVIDSTVSVVQSTGKATSYNSEMELSTDTDDSGSEMYDKPDLVKMEEVMKDMDAEVKERVLAIAKRMSKEYENVLGDNKSKESKIDEMAKRMSELERQVREFEREREQLREEKLGRILEDERSKKLQDETPHEVREAQRANSNGHEEHLEKLHDEEESPDGSPAMNGFPESDADEKALPSPADKAEAVTTTADNQSSTKPDDAGAVFNGTCSSSSSSSPASDVADVKKQCDAGGGANVQISVIASVENREAIIKQERESEPEQEPEPEPDPDLEPEPE